MLKTDSESKAAAASIIMEPECEIKAASAPSVDVIEQDLSTNAKILADLISFAIAACNNSDPDVFVSLNNDLQKGAGYFVYAARKLIDVRGNAGYPYAKEKLRSIYHDLLQKQCNALKLLKNRHDHLAEVKVCKSALDESRQN